MAKWNEEKANGRVNNNDFHEMEIIIQDLTREMDFSNLSKTDVRRVQGIHTYHDITNINELVDAAGNDQQKQRKLIRASKVIRTVRRELTEDVGIERMQHQNLRLHTLCYKPYNNGDGTKEKERAQNAVLHAISLQSLTVEVINPIFSNDIGIVHSAVGLADGESYILNIGFHGERELLSIGHCANIAAKIINAKNTITITKTLYDALPSDLQVLFTKSGTLSGESIRQAHDVLWSQHATLAEKYKVTFDAEKLKTRAKGICESLALDDITISEATGKIDIEKLTEKNCKRTSVAMIYADLDGYTKLVQEATEADDRVALIRALHMVRAEFHAVIQSKECYDGVVIQHQGDRVVALLNLPSDDEKGRRNDAVEIAIGLQSSLLRVINPKLKAAHQLSVSIGVAEGLTMVTRLGKQGQREVFVIGRQVIQAEQLQIRSKGGEIRILQNIYDSIENKTCREQFKQQAEGSQYVATNLTFPKLDEIEAEEAARQNSLGARLSTSVASARLIVGNTTYNRKPYLQQELARNVVMNTTWHQIFPERWKQEQEVAARFLQDQESWIDEQGRANIRGWFPLISQHEAVLEKFDLRITYPTDFPRQNRPPAITLLSHNNRYHNCPDAHKYLSKINLVF